MVYERLRAIASSRLGRSRRGALETTALVHEAYLQLVEETGVPWQNRSHFFAICASAMRRIVVDHARRHAAAKRGGGELDLTLDPGLVGVEEQAELVLAVHQALERLAVLDERLIRVVECRYFAGMTEEETAEALGISLRTAQRDWMRARGWLRKELEDSSHDPARHLEGGPPRSDKGARHHHRPR